MRRPSHLASHAVHGLILALPGFVAGTALQLFQPQLWPGAGYVLLLVLGALGLVASARWLAPGWPKLAAWTVLLATVAFGCTGLRAVVFGQHALAASIEGRDVTVTGVVAAMPQNNEAGSRFRLRVESALLDGKPAPLPELIYLGWYSGATAAAGPGELAGLQRQPADLRAGERWRMLVRLKAPHGNLNPHGFDYELWLWEQGLQATGYLRAGSSDPAPQLLGQTAAHPLENLRQSVRDRIFAHLGERRTAGLLAALVVGDQNAIDRSDWDMFRATGVAHLMSISGLHVTMFAWFAAALVGVLWRRSARLCLWVNAPHAAILGGLVLATAYALFSGWGVPSQRTIWMLLTVGVLRLSARQWPWPMVWLLACAVVVAVDPWAMLQAGFWLSFVAVGVLFASAPPTARGAKAGARLRALLREQGVVTVALTPLSLLLFGQASVIGLVANLLAIPWVTLVVTPMALAGVLFAPLWDLAGMATSLLGWVLEQLMRLPFVSVSVAQAPLWAGVTGVLGGTLLVLRLPWTLRVAGVPLLLPVLLWQGTPPPVGGFEVLAADIGQGNAVLVRTASHALLYDTGPRFSRESDAGHRVLVPLLRSLDVRLDSVVLSHRDSDHVGGALAVLSMQRDAQVLSSIEPENELQVVRRITRCEAGQEWAWDGVVFKVLHPQAGDYAGSARPNALSCVVHIRGAAPPGARPRAALLAGDIERAQEERLARGAMDIQADLLLAPHHGSKTSSSAEFLDAVAPGLIVVQAGYRNRFGHPADAVLQRYHERQAVVVDSPHCGAFTWQSWQPQSGVCQRQLARRYWHHSLP